jgi:hypothetical protein
LDPSRLFIFENWQNKANKFTRSEGTGNGHAMQQEFSCSDSEAVYMRQGTVPKHNNVYASAPVPDSSVVDPE